MAMSFVLLSNGLFAERPAVESAYCRGLPLHQMMSRRLALVLFLARLIRKPLPISMKSRLPVMAVKRFSAYLL